MIKTSQERFERPTYCLGGSCSVQLSYWDTVAIIAHDVEFVKKTGDGIGCDTM